MDAAEEQRIAELVWQKLEGRSYSEIREELRRDGLEEEEIRRLIRLTDARVLDQEVEGSRPDRGRQLYAGGLALAVAGLLLSISFNLGVILREWPAMAVYTPFFAGILVMLTAKRLPGREKKKKEGSGAIRKQRPYK